GRHHRRHGQPRRRGDRRACRRPCGQFRQGPVPRSVLFHALRADGADPRDQADRPVRTRLINMGSQRAKIIIVALCLAALALIVPHSGSFVVLLATRAMAFAILAMSVDLLLGYTGLSSMGQAAYFVVGAFLTAFLSTQIHLLLRSAFLFVFLI